jgi:predicted ATP-grasp superfamily ATP-dependent carboligase
MVTVRPIKDPLAFAAVAGLLGVPHPEVRLAAPGNTAGWLSKRAGAAGGSHVRSAGRRLPRGRGWYWQRRVRGEPHSALVVGNGREAQMLAFGRQLLAPTAGRPFRFGGTVAPAEISDAALEKAAAAATILVERYALRGLASVDMLVDGDEIIVLEVNPRPGASLDAYRRGLSADLFAAHVAGCRGEAVPAVTARATGGSLIVHARRSMLVPDQPEWPDWAADRSPPGTRIASGGPICTVLAEGADGSSVERCLRTRAETILAVYGQHAGVRRAALCLEAA